MSAFAAFATTPSYSAGLLFYCHASVLLIGGSTWLIAAVLGFARSPLLARRLVGFLTPQSA